MEQPEPINQPQGQQINQAPLSKKYCSGKEFWLKKHLLSKYGQPSPLSGRDDTQQRYHQVEADLGGLRVHQQTQPEIQHPIQILRGATIQIAARLEGWRGHQEQL